LNIGKTEERLMYYSCSSRFCRNKNKLDDWKEENGKLHSCLSKPAERETFADIRHGEEQRIAV